MNEVMKQAYALIGDRTPLKTDCGALCSARCCGVDDDGQGGVWLYEGEVENLADEAWCRVSHWNEGALMTCTDMCDREKRPFGCRIFPLAPVKREDGSWTVRMDARAKAICPVASRGLKGLDGEFVRSCAAAVRKLAEDAEMEQLLEKRQAEEDEYRRDAAAIRSAFSL